MPRGLVYDRWLVFTVGLLLLGGLFMIGSASTYFAMDTGRSPSAFWWKHALHLLAGTAALLFVLSFPYQRLASRHVVVGVMTVTAIGLLLVLATPSIAGARRWIPLGPFHVQPAEFAKLAVVLFMASLLSRKEDRVNEAQAVPIPALIVVACLSGLVLAERDLGTSAVIAGLAAVMLFVAGLRWRAIFGLGALGMLVFSMGVLIEPYRVRRVIGFLDPWADPHDTGFQLIQSLLAFGNGGIHGVGLGNGQQKAFFLPAAHTDFIFSIVGEELGLVGCLTLLAAFLLLFWRGMRAAWRAPDRFGFYLATGMTCLLVLPALLNMCVCLGLVPTKGLPLPFISYGGSSLLASMTAAGVLLNVSKHSN